MKKQHLKDRQESALIEELDRDALLKVEIFSFLMENENARELGWTGMRLALHEVIGKIEGIALEENAGIGRRPCRLRAANEARERFLKEAGWYR